MRLPVLWQFVHVDLQRLEQPGDVLVAREHEQLVSPGRKITQDGRCGLRTLHVEVDQYVVEHQR